MIPDLLIALVKSPTTEYSVQKEEEGGSTSTQDDFAIGGPLEIHHYSWIISGFFTFLSVLVSVWIIVEHIRYYKEPARQRFMVRIIVMVPIYALGSYFSLLWRHYAFYFALVRDCYESYVLYMFFRLLIELGDSEEVMIQKMEQVRQIKCYWPLCFWHIKPGRIFLHRCKQFILQFVLLKPILAIVTFLLELSDSYREGNFAPQYGYLYICLIYNISITFALWFLVLFYEATKDILKQYKPISKFLCIKSIIFFSYWQSVVIAIMLHFNILIRGKGDWSITDVAVGLQNFLICVEMFPLAVSHAVSFGPQAYKDETIGEFLVEPNLVERIVDVANVADVFYDTYVALKLGPKRNVVVAGSYGNFFDQSREKMAEIAVKHGWIEKRGEDIAKIWKRRYCMILSDPVGLVYFKFNPLETPDGQFIKARGWVNFEGMTEVRPHPKSNVRWTVVTPARNWHFRCADSQQREEWIEACKGLKIEEIYN